MKSLIFFLPLLASGAALADPCVTSSRGLSFYSNNYDTNYSSRAAVGACQSNAMTQNYECQSNLRCGFNVANPYPSGMIVCSSTSRGMTFDVQNPDIGTASSQAVSQCTSNPATNNADCTSTLTCRDSSQGGMVTGRAMCRTQSRGIEFRASGFGMTNVSTSVYNSCTSSRLTSNSECQANMSCTDNYSGPELSQNVYCTTQSRGLSFRLAGIGMTATTEGVINQCDSNPYTNNQECQSNLSCQYQDFVPAPGPIGGPVPPPVVVVPGGGPVAGPIGNPLPPVYNPPVYTPPAPQPHMWACDLTINPYTRYTGHGYDQNQAATDARQSCIRSTNDPFTCNRQSSIVCHVM